MLNAGLLREVRRFGIVGAVGFVVDASLLFVLVKLGCMPLLARLVSFPAAITATWLLNSRWTYGHRQRREARTRQAAGYVIVQCCGATINYLVFALALPLVGRTSPGAVVALAAGSAVGMFVNFIGAKFIVFREVTP